MVAREIMVLPKVAPIICKNAYAALATPAVVLNLFMAQALQLGNIILQPIRKKRNGTIMANVFIILQQ